MTDQRIAYTEEMVGNGHPTKPDTLNRLTSVQHDSEGKHNLSGFQGSQYAAPSGGSDTYVITLDPVPAAYFNGMTVAFKADVANTGAATLNCNSLGAKTIKKAKGEDLATGDVLAGQMVIVVYDGTYFQMISQLSSSGVGKLSQIDVGNIRLLANTLSTLSGDLTIDPAGGDTIIDSNVGVEGGNLNVGSPAGSAHPLNIASSGGSNLRLIGRDNGSTDEATILFQHYDGSIAHGRIQGLSSRLDFYGGTTHTMTLQSGNIAIGTTSLGSGGSGCMIYGHGTKPTGLSNVAGFRAADVSGTTEMHAFDEAGNETQLTAHANDAPSWLYDPQDASPMIVREVQWLLGYVRWTNQTRLSRLLAMSSAERDKLSVEARTCGYAEDFEDYNARLNLTGDTALKRENLTAVISAQRDEWKKKWVEENTTESEVLEHEALELYAKEIKYRCGEEAVKVLTDNGLETVLKPKMAIRTEPALKLKNGCRYDCEMDVFCQNNVPTDVAAEAAAEAGFKHRIPVRIVNLLAA